MERTWVSALILGAGQARRMGLTKQLLPFGRTTLLGQVLGNVLASQVQETVLILGHEAGAILRALGLNHPDPEEGLNRSDKIGFKVRINPEYAEGLSSSIRLGVSSLAPQAAAVMIVLGDQPLIDPLVIDFLIATFRASGRGIVAPFYGGRRGHPILLHLKYRESMLGLRGDVGCREILSTCSEDLLEVEVDCPGVVQDVDTLEEYRRCRESLK
ncbi:MAG: nucleotidyltransferase family protein [Nitrospinae bacterium]|nr:nucleotidyltransferase family protein [Nitrospinota bacterium]